MRQFVSKILISSFVVFCATSCSSFRYHQIATFSSDQVTLNTNGCYVADEDIVLVQYDFWSEYGKIEFQIFNMTDSDIKIDLARSFLIMNGVSEDYWNDQPYMYVPANSSVVLEYKPITNTIHRECGLPLDPRLTEESIKYYNVNNSPMVLENKLMLIKGEEEVSIHHIFYVSEIQNIAESKAVKEVLYILGCSGESQYCPHNVFIMESPNRYFVKYQWDENMYTDSY